MNNDKSENYKIFRREPNPYNFNEFIDNFSILKLFVWRDLKVRYRHTFLGISWFVLQPLVMMLVIAFGFQFAFSRNSNELPFILYVASGLVLWTHFANGFAMGATSLESFKGIIQKISFQRAYLPLVPIITAIVDMLCSSILLVVMLFIYKCVPSWRIIFIPLLILWGTLFIYGLALFFSAASVLYKDLKHLISFLIQILFFCSPVFLESSVIYLNFSILAYLNPLVGYLNIFRWLIFEEYPQPKALEWILFLIIAPLLFLFGYRYFEAKQGIITDTL